MVYFNIKTGQILNEYEINNIPIFQMFKGWTPLYNLKGKYFGAIIGGKFYSLEEICDRYGFRRINNGRYKSRN